MVVSVSEHCMHNANNQIAKIFWCQFGNRHWIDIFTVSLAGIWSVHCASVSNPVFLYYEITCKYLNLVFCALCCISLKAFVVCVSKWVCVCIIDLMCMSDSYYDGVYYQYTIAHHKRYKKIANKIFNGKNPYH